MQPPSSPPPPRGGGRAAPAPEINDDYGTPEAPPEPPTEERGSSWGEILNSPLARTIANQVTRGLMGALLGPTRRAPRRRRRTY